METLKLLPTFVGFLIFLVTFSLVVFLSLYPFKKYFVIYNEVNEESEFKKETFYLFSFLISLLMLFIVNKVDSAFYEYLLQTLNHFNPFLIILVLASVSSIFFVNFVKSENSGTFTIPISTHIGIPIEFITLLVSIFVLFGQLAIYGLLFIVLSMVPVFSLALTIAGLSTLLAVTNFGVKMYMDID